MNNFSITKFMYELTGGDGEQATRLMRLFMGMPGEDTPYTGPEIKMTHPLEKWAKAKGYK